MKIVDIKGYVIEEPIKHQFVWRAGLPGSGATSTSTCMTLMYRTWSAAPLRNYNNRSTKDTKKHAK